MSHLVTTYEIDGVSVSLRAIYGEINVFINNDGNLAYFVDSKSGYVKGNIQINNSENILEFYEG